MNIGLCRGEYEVTKYLPFRTPLPFWRFLQKDYSKQTKIPHN